MLRKKSWSTSKGRDSVTCWVCDEKSCLQQAGHSRVKEECGAAGDLGERGEGLIFSDSLDLQGF